MNYGMNDRLPDPPSPDWECNDCGTLFDIPKWDEAICPNCDSGDIHRA